MIRVLHLFANLNLGGAESRMMDIYRTQEGTGVVNEFVIMTDEVCYFSDEILTSGGTIHHIPNPRHGLLSNLLGLYRLLKCAPQYDVLHAHTSYYSGIAVFIAWLAGLKVRVVHARNKSTNEISFKTKAMFALGRTLANICATHKFAISNDAGRFLFGHKSQYDCLPNAFNFEQVQHRTNFSDSDKRRLGLPTNTLNLVCIARFSPVKNHQFLVELLQFITERNLKIAGKAVCLHLIGDGELRNKMERKVSAHELQGKVRFWGKRNDIADILGMFDVALMTSFNEGLGVFALEAQAAGLPCVLSTGLPEEADIGLGMCQFIDLKRPISDWQVAIEKAANIPVLPKHRIDNQLKQRGYTLEQTRSTLIRAYNAHG
ncbi:glycosyltransferase [Thalassotalea montiporae]